MSLDDGTNTSEPTQQHKVQWLKMSKSQQHKTQTRWRWRWCNEENVDKKNVGGRETNNQLWVSTTAPTRRSQHNPAKLKTQSALVTKNTELTTVRKHYEDDDDTMMIFVRTKNTLSRAAKNNRKKRSQTTNQQTSREQLLRPRGELTGYSPPEGATWENWLSTSCSTSPPSGRH